MAAALLGASWSAESRVVLLPYGISLAPFARRGGGPELRREHGIPDGVPVFGRVGRMAPEKNHGHLLEVAGATLARAPEARFVLIGAGPLKAEIMQRAQRLGIAHSVVFPDPATDHLRWMTEVFSAFIFPSLFEGIPIALIEAQAAGLPCLLPENVVPPAVDVIPSLLSRLAFQAGPEAWACALLEMGRRPRLPVADATSIVAGTVFNIQQSRRAIERIYDRRQ